MEWSVTFVVGDDFSVGGNGDDDDDVDDADDGQSPWHRSSRCICYDPCRDTIDILQANYGNLHHH